jgi:hypothetical protein
MSTCIFIPHGPEEPCTCNGCWRCDGAHNENYQQEHMGEQTMDMYLIATGGHVMGCTCDIDWDHVYGNHTDICGGYNL